MRLKLTRGNSLKIKASTRIPAQLVGGNGITVTRENGTYTFDMEEAEILDIIGPAVLNRANHTGTQLASTISDFSEAVDDRVGSLLVAGDNISLTYNDGANTLTINADGEAPTEFATRALAAAATIDVSVTSIRILRHTAGYPLCPAIYIPGTVSGPMAFQEAGGNYWELDVSSGIFHAPWFGARGNGVADDTTAFSNLLSAVNASTAANVLVYLGAGSYRISSSTLSTGLVLTRSDVIVDGNGATITVTGASQMNFVFSSSNQSRIHYRNINFVGNSVATAFALGSAIGFTNTNTDIVGLLVEDCSFTNFKGDYWIFVQPGGAYNNSIQNININRNYFLSANGNARGPTNVAINSAFVLAYGVGNSGGTSTPSPNAFVRGVRVTNNQMRADYIKTGVQIFDNVQDIYIAGNRIYSAGQLGGITDDQGSYAIMLYENESPSTTNYSAHATVVGNYISNVRDNGVYMAGPWTDSVISGNIVDTQTSTATTTLPKGGISINGGVGTTITNNRLISIAGDGITLVAPTATTDGEWLIANNYVNASLSACIRILNAGYSATKVSVLGNIIKSGASTVGVMVYVFPSGSYTSLKIEGNNINGGTYGIRFVPDSGTLTLTNVSVCHNDVVSPTSYGIDIRQIAAGGPVLLDGNVVTGAPSNASFSITDTVNGVFQNNVVSGQNSGVGWTTAGARGTMRGNSFDRVAAANMVATVGATDLGRVEPTWTPAGSGHGTVVQKLVPVEAGTASSKYVIREWFYNVDTTDWVEQRMLTGN